MTTINLSDVIPYDADDISELLEKIKQAKIMQHDLTVISIDLHASLVMKFIENGEHDALQVKPSILKRYTN